MTSHSDYFQVDCFTGRTICWMCWDRVHGSKRTEGVCPNACCNCGCRSAPAARRKERVVKQAARNERKATQQASLEASPLQANNPGQQEPWIKLPHARSRSFQRRTIMTVELPDDVALRPCPICGSDARLKTNITINSQSQFWVKCTNPECGISPAATFDQHVAIDRWNTRSSDVPQQASYTEVGNAF
jgi:hypothetical protein